VRSLAAPHTVLLALVLAAGGGCAGSNAALRLEEPGRGLRSRGVGAPDDVTVRGARILPESLDEGHVWGAAAGGGERLIVAGERVVSRADGAIEGAADRLPAAPTGVVEVPERMGGGFLFAMGSRLWRADTWLGRAEPLVSLPNNVVQVQVGLDRVYVRTLSGALFAIDPKLGKLVGLGPLPATPALGHMAALDAWRAVAIADLRGVLLTLDAGSTWRPLALPIEPADVVLLEDSIAVGGNDATHEVQWWEVRPDGQVGRLSGAPSGRAGADEGATPDPATHVFGARPLATAIADGWPLTDGTALVARDGSLGRVRLSDGALVETARDAFAMKPARCHPLALARKDDPGAFGFVCGQPRGQTAVYRYVAREGRLAESHRWDGPREVLSFGNGALAARGGCAPDANDDATGGDLAFCIMPPGGAWAELHFRGEDVERARPVVLHDGRVALVRPPRGEDLSTLRLTLTDGVHSTHTPVVMPPLRADVARALRIGLWMDGFEERRDGVVGGWVDAGGSVVGVEIAVDGQAKIGSYIRAASDVFVAGRYGLGWTASRRGMETVDGGMTWKDLDVPEPIAPARAPHERACGPVGCLAAGWMRVGWGEPEKQEVKEKPGRGYVVPRVPPRLELQCAGLSGKAPEPRVVKPARRPVAGAQPGPTVSLGRWGASVLAPGMGAGSTELPPFESRPPPAMGSDDAGLTIELTTAVDRALRSLSLARVYAWGPKSGDWDQLGRWSVAWTWPFGGWPDVRASATAAAPWTSIDNARRAMQVSTGAAGGWLLASGDDPDHALLVVRRLTAVTTTDVITLETDRAPFEVHRAGGEPFPDVEAAQRVGGRWYLATVQPQGELSATVLWLVDGGLAREIARIPRVGTEAHTPVRLARRTDGRALGVLVDSVPDAERGTTRRWVVSVDLESSAVGEPEPLAPVDLTDRGVTVCSGDDTGWEADLPYPGTVVLDGAPKWRTQLQSPLARMRLSRERACVERLTATVDATAFTGAEGLARAGAGAGVVPRGARTVDVGLSSSRMRSSVRCWSR
jgi:hypothetical protein